MVISDTHNDTEYTELALEVFAKDKYDRLFVLGDIGIDTLSLLNPLHEKILAVKGNCDGYELDDFARFPLPYLNYAYAFDKFIVLTHGNYYNEFNYDQKYDILLEGHSHISGLVQRKDGRIIANPGSLSLPRDYNHSFLSIDEQGLKAIDVKTGEIVHFLDF